MINEKRIRLLQKGKNKKGPISYWMSRDQRLYDNWAVFFAEKLTAERKENFCIVFCLVPNFLEATIRQYGFMLKGLKEIQHEAKKHNIPFYILIGKPEEEIPKFIKEKNISNLISDFDPLRIKRSWKDKTAKKINIPFYEVDAHNIVPCLYVSKKLEFAAYTVRPKINKNLNEFLDEYSILKKQRKVESLSFEKINWEAVEKKLQINFDVKEIDWAKPGTKAGIKMMENFFKKRFKDYNEKRNDPTKIGQSKLSPYLHFGQISAQRVALETKRFSRNIESEKSFLEELIVRRELSDNFCFYNKNYDSTKGFPDWAKKTLNEHRKDEREFIYSLKKFEDAETHEDLWNAAQIELKTTGKLHGYMRMYWAKKILEWTKSPEVALKIAIYLNDKYELDGRDPNGYVGCAWAIGGVHDRAWAERPVYGKIRYMNRNGAKRKFDIEKYIQKFQKVS